MNLRLYLTIILAATCFVGVMLYNRNWDQPEPITKQVYIYSTKTSEHKQDISFIRNALKSYGIERNRITENPTQTTTDPCIKIFFEQSKFDNCIEQDDVALKIAVRLKGKSDEDSKAIGAFEEDKSEDLLEFIESVVKKPINCLIIFDGTDTSLQQSVTRFQELAKIKELKWQTCALAANRNLATVLKEADQNVNAVILIACPLVLAESELIFEHFDAHKIPVFANHVDLIRAGALGGFDFDAQEIAYAIAEIASSFLKDASNIRGDALEELYPQLHLNMDKIAALGMQLSSHLLDEAVTVGGADL